MMKGEKNGKVNGTDLLTISSQILSVKKVYKISQLFFILANLERYIVILKIH